MIEIKSSNVEGRIIKWKFQSVAEILKKGQAAWKILYIYPWVGDDVLERFGIKYFSCCCHSIRKQIASV